MAPSFAELKERAGKAKDAGVTKFQNTRDRHTSVPMASTNWDPYSKKPPPPPPPPRASSSTASHAGTAPPPVPPPIVRTTRPTIPARHLGTSESTSPQKQYPPPPKPHNVHKPSYNHAEAEPETEIDWANLSPEDKEVFFSWLDEFFAWFFHITIPPRSTTATDKPVVPQPAPRRPAPTPVPAAPVNNDPGPPPKIALWSRPKLPSTTPSPDPTSLPNDLTLSHPPATTRGSAALDLAYYFHPSTSWSTPWYSSNTLQPPPLAGDTHHTYAASSQWSNTTKQIFCGVLFSDLSLCWASVEFSTAVQADPNNTSQVKRHAEYLARPKALGKVELVEAWETYGETIAAFAESFVGTGEYCSRGECWDLAHEALKYFNDFDYVPKPIPSISRTHGHLIFEGKASGLGNTSGRWRGGDDRVRRGDIVEWRRVKIGLVGARRGSWAILGDPDHTAVIVRDSLVGGGRTVGDGEMVKPEELGSLEVVEQSVGSPPAKNNYDLGAFEEGEMWIYRPIGMEAYLGVLFGAKCPVGVRTMTI